MKLHKKGFRRFGVGVILSWSLVPIYWVINTSFQTDAQISDTPAHLFPPTPGWANYKALLIGDGELPSMIRRATINIFIECISATIITVVLASLAAYAFARMEFKGRKFFLFVVVMTMAFPTYTTLIPMYRIMAMVHLVNTYHGIILCYVSGFLPLATWILFSYMQSLPLAIEEAENAKKIAKFLKDEGPKSLKTQIQGDELRVISKSRDDLQEAMAKVKENPWDFAVQFVNFR